MLQEVKSNIDKARPDFIYGRLTVLTSDADIETIANTLCSSEYALPLLKGEAAKEMDNEGVAIVNNMHLLFRFAQPKDSIRDSIEEVVFKPLGNNPATQNAIVAVELAKHEIQDGLAMHYTADGLVGMLPMAMRVKSEKLEIEDSMPVLALARIIKEQIDYQYEELSEEAAQYTPRPGGEYSFDDLREFTIRYHNMRPEDFDAKVEAEVKVSESDLNSIAGDNTQ